MVGPDAWLLSRIFPGVPALWVGMRLLALAGAATLLSAFAPVGVMATALRRDPDAAPSTFSPLAGTALAIAVLHAGLSPVAGRLGPLGQVAYLVALFVPALLLAWPASSSGRSDARGPWSREVVAVTVVIAVWIALRLATDLGSPRVADAVDAWRGWIDDLTFVAQKKNLLINLYDPHLPGVGAALLVFHGVPIFQAEILPLTFRTVQLLQIGWVAASAAGLAALVWMVVGPGVSAVAAAMFLFSPYMRFLTLFPGPFLAGPLYVTPVAAFALLAWRRRSDAALAAMGAAAGIAVTFPSAIPIVGVIVALALWSLRDEWRARWVGMVASLAGFLAAVVPALSEVLVPSQLGSHFRWDGLVSIIDASLIGQLGLRGLPPAWQNVEPRPFDAVAAALLGPFAHPRLAVRLWGDAIFDPVGGALIAVGIATCVRRARHSALAGILLLMLLASLSPAFVSPVDVVDITHAVALPVPAVLLAAIGFVVVVAAVPRATARATAWATAVGTLVVALGGTWLFDVVTPRVVGASAYGVMFQALRPELAERAVALTYGAGFVRPTKTLFAGPITAFGGPRPVGYLEYDGGELPADGLAAEGKDLVFWSHGFDQDVAVRTAVCAQWPGATLYEIWDVGHISRVYAARIGARPWEPELPADRWRAAPCPPSTDPAAG